MAFAVDEFRANLALDGARPNLFQVRLALPNLPGVNDQNMLSFMCNAAQLPGSDIGVITQYYFGREVKIAGNRTYADWTVTVINDEDFAVRNAMEAWHQAINEPINNLRDINAISNAPASLGGGYGAQAFVDQYAKTGEVVKTYEFTGMWPTSISPIELNWGTNDQLEEFTVTFAYQYWKSSGVIGEQNSAPIPGAPPAPIAV